MAPELLTETREYGKEIDIWSLGVLLFQMLTGKMPFESFMDIKEANYAFPRKAKLSDEAKDLIKGML